MSEVVRLDPGGLTLVERRARVEVFRLSHTFTATVGGTQCDSVMTLGTSRLLLRWPVNKLIRPKVFSEAMGRAWLRHNVDEVGLLETLAPMWYADQNG